MTIPNTSHMSTGQKAAATRRARKAAGLPPKTTRRRRLIFLIPKPDPVALSIQALATLEDALVAKLACTVITDSAERAFARYQKVKALALGGLRSTCPETVAEATSALRFAAIEAIKLVL